MLLPYIENNSHFNRDRSRKDCDNLSYFLSIFFSLLPFLVREFYVFSITYPQCHS